MTNKRRNLRASFFFFSALTLSLLLSSCATFLGTKEKKGPPSTEEKDPAQISDAATLEQDTNSTDDSSQQAGNETDPSHIEKLSIEDIIRIEEPNTRNLYDNSRYDFPITINSRVEGWIDYFTGRGRQHMELYLSRSSRYLPLMKNILKREGIPEDLVFLALIESGFSLKARSRARAVGPWQFMRATAIRYGLRVDAWIDERRDPILSTEAAARYLKDLYLMFESWYLAASAYNAGEYKILRAIENLKTNNYWTICSSRAIRRETKNYVPKLISAAIIGKNPARYGFTDIAYMEPLEFEMVTVSFPVHLREIAKLIDEPEVELEDLNPMLARKMIPPGIGPFELRIPMGRKVLVERAIATIRGKLAPADMPKEHLVKGGETLSSIARKYGIYRNHLANVNNLSPKTPLNSGMKVIIPEDGKVPAYKIRSKREYADGFGTHKVRSGDSLWSIAIKYNVTVQELFVWNDLERSRLFPGMSLKYKRQKNLADAKRHSQEERKIDSDGFVTYVVQPGDTLWDICQQHNITIRDLKRWNNLSRSRIYPGKELRIKSSRKSNAQQENSIYFRIGASGKMWG